MEKILIFDNYDSFTYNLVHLVKELCNAHIEVHRNDCISLEEVGRFDKIILSPGPGIPEEAGLLLPSHPGIRPDQKDTGCLFRASSHSRGIRSHAYQPYRSFSRSANTCKDYWG